MMPEQTNDGCYELIDAAMVESCGMFATAQDAADYANVHQIRAYEVWRDEFLVMEKRSEDADVADAA